MSQARAKRFLKLLSPPKQPRVRSVFEGSIKAVRDRGLDHAVERERNLKALVSLKNLIKGEPSNSLPISLIKRSLSLPSRPIEFIRKYPSVFQEFLPAALTTSPHVRLTPETLRLDADHHLLQHSDRFKQLAADRLLKLLMIGRVRKIPLPLVATLQWDLGLPDQYGETMVPHFPDYFRIADGFLELVCWDHGLAVSVLQSRNQSESRKGDHTLKSLFPVQFSNGFEMDKKYEKWLREWLEMPYESPYENFSHLPSSSEESDVWVVSVMHEVLHLFVGKKIEKEALLEFGDWLGLRSRFKRALLQHPGIFYVSSKIGTYTVVLREGYKRGALIEDHPLMNLRNQYLHLMNSVREEGKTGKVVLQGNGGLDEVEGKGVEGVEGEGDGETLEAREEEASQVEDASETDFYDSDEEEPRRGSRKTATGRRGREFRKEKLRVDKPLRDSSRERSPLRDSSRERSPLRRSQMERSPFSGSQRKRSTLRGSRMERSPLRGSQRETLPLRGSRMERLPFRGSQRERSIGKTGENNSFEVSKRRQLQGGHEDVENTQERSRSFKSSRRSLTSKKTPIL